MNICILTTSITLHRMGGTEVHAETIARAAAKTGHHVTLVTTAHPQGKTREEKDGYSIEYLPGTHFEMSREHLQPWWTESSKKISELWKNGLIDIVWAENLSAQYYVSKVPSLRRPPIISIINGPGIRGDLKSQWAQVNSLSAFGYFIAHALPQAVFYSLPWFWRVTKHSEFLVTVSDYCELEIRKEFPACRTKTMTILNPVDTLRFQPSSAVRMAARERYGIAADAPTAAMSGVLYRQKGMHHGIEAFKLIKSSLPEAKLIIAGDGPEMNPLKALAGQLGLTDSVIFCGAIANKDMNIFYNTADIYLNPTLRQEGLPIVILEALACGLPCVITLAGGNASAIENGIDGFFVTPGKIDELAEKAVLLLGNPALLKTMSANARQRAGRVFGMGSTISKYLELSESIIKTRTR